jgi:antirestriction protein ArdC
MASTIQEKKERVQQLRQTVHELAEAISNGDSDATFDQYLTWISKLHRYSWGNICLMMWEWNRRRRHRDDLAPLSHVGSYRRWKKLDRQVRKGEKGIPILVPWKLKGKTRIDDDTGEEEFLPPKTVFRVGHVFDISQTEGDEAPNFKRDLGQDLAMIIPPLLDLAQDEGIDVRFVPTGKANGSSHGGQITVSDRLPPGIQAQTLVHELAHELLHQRHTDKHQVLQDKALIEGEAEAVSVVVMRALGHDVASNGAAYIRSHGADAKLILKSLERITDTARQLLDAIHPDTTNDS